MPKGNRGNGEMVELQGWVATYPRGSLRIRSCDLGDGVEMTFCTLREHATEIAENEGDMIVVPATLTWERDDAKG